MKTLHMLLGVLAFFYAFMDLIHPFLKKFREEGIKMWFLEKCKTVDSLNDEELTLKLRPWVYGLGFSFMILGSIVLHTKGSDHPDIFQLSLAGMISILVVSYGLISYHELSVRMKNLTRVGYKITKWVTISILCLTILLLNFYVVLNDLPISSIFTSENLLFFLYIFACCVFAGIISDLIVAGILLYFPYYSGRVLIWTIRKVSKYVVTKGRKDSTRIILLIFGLLSVSRGIYLYLIE